MYHGEARHPVMIALAETVKRHAHPHRPVRGPDIGLRAGPDGHGIPDVRTVARLLHAVGQPRGHLVLYVAGAFSPGERATGRRDLHGPSTGQFLAGRRPRPGHRPHLFAARGSGSIRLSRRRPAGLAIHARVRRAAAVRGRAGSRASCPRVEPWCRAFRVHWPSTSTCFPAGARRFSIGSRHEGLTSSAAGLP